MARVRIGRSISEFEPKRKILTRKQYPLSGSSRGPRSRQEVFEGRVVLSRRGMGLPSDCQTADGS